MTPHHSRNSLHRARLIGLTLGVSWALGAAALRADVAVYEGFDYPAGDLVGQAGGSGWSGPWHGVDGANTHGAVLADSLKGSTTIATAGGHMQTSEGDTPLLREITSPLFAAPGVTWISFLARNDSGQTDSTYSFLKLAAAKGSDDDSIRVGKDFFGKNWQVWKGSQTQDLNVASDSNTVLSVLRIESTGKPGSDSIQVFLNPATGAAPTTPTATLTALSLKPLDEVAIQSGNGVKTFSYDEIRIGTTFADVVPAAAPASPGNANK